MKWHVTKIFIIFLFHVLFELHGKPELIDFEANLADFILETKKINVPGFPGAFNPCIVRWKNLLLMSFRVRDHTMISTFEIGFVWLDEELNPISKPRILDISDRHITTFFRRQDPRLITLGDDLYIIYSNFITINTVVTRRMFIAKVHYDHGSFYTDPSVCIQSFEGASDRWEKNWAPFVHRQQLLLAYSINPHLIFKPSLKTGDCQTESSSKISVNWPFGELRGGTPAIKNGSEYLAFFHSSIPMQTVHSNGKRMPHYVMGAYTFSAEPPFTITHISPTPIVGKNFYNGPVYNTWKPLRVVFPMGYVMDEKYIWLAYGRQDFECWVAKLDKKRLLDSLIACHPVNKEIDSQPVQELLNFNLQDVNELENSSKFVYENS